MHLMLHIFLLMLYSFSQVLAQATPMSSSTPIPSNSVRTASIATTSISQGSVSRSPILTHRPISTLSRNPHTLTTFHVPTLVTFTHNRPLAEPTLASDRGPGSRGPPRGHRKSHQQKPIIIFFEVLCGILVFGILVCLLRCCYSYKRTPSHDRVMGVVNRYRLQQELEDLERNPLARRPASVDEPAPPYLPRPPSYISFIEPSQPAPVAQTYATSYAEVSSASPPSSPVFRRSSLEVLMPQASNSSDSPNR